MAGKNDAEKIEDSELAVIMRQVSGRNVIRRLLVKTGYWGDTFDPDPLKHAFNAGRRNIGCSLMSELKTAAPGELETMIKEHIHAAE